MTAPTYERRDLPAGGAALALGGLFALLLFAATMVWLVVGLVAPNGTATANGFTAHPPPPWLEVSPPAARIAIEAAARARLRGDAAHPSIEQAMRIVAREGWREGAP